MTVIQNAVCNKAQEYMGQFDFHRFEVRPLRPMRRLLNAVERVYFSDFYSFIHIQDYIVKGVTGEPDRWR